MNKREKGKEYEDKAAVFLEQNGYKIIERNFMVKSGEIDIIAEDGDTVCFVEVKYRKNLEFGFPGEAINLNKQKIIIKTSQLFIKKNKYNFDKNYRFDVVLILGNKIELVKNAFGGL